jgi:hypothetical protein
VARAGVVVVPTPGVRVVDRRVVVLVRAVGAGAGVGAAVVVAAVGCSGAAAFRTWVPANAVMPPREVSVIAVASPRSIVLERMSGEALDGARAAMCSRRTRAPPRRVRDA